MARILLASAGTTGELAPFVALGRALAARGHRVRLAYNSAFHAEIREAGIEPVACGPGFGKREFLERPELFDRWKPYPVEALVETWKRLDLGRCAQDVIAASRDADVLVASTLVPFGPLVEQAVGVPWIAVTTVPFQLHAPSDDPRRRAEREALLDLLQEVWADAGLPSGGARAGLDLSPRALLVASSRHFSQPERAAPLMELTGFWFHDHPWWGRWEPSERLLAFVEREPPLVLTLSSQPLARPGDVLATYAEAAHRLDLPLLAFSGWSPFSEADLPRSVPADRVLVSPPCPHGWILPRARAVVHHGGIGVTARALLAGCPALVQPYTGEQVFNAWRVRALGAGAAVHPHLVDSVSAARILERAVLDVGVRERTRAVGPLLAAEDGLARACQLLEAWLGTR